jgi:hypothetical protein
VVGPDELASDIALSDADLRAEYEHRIEDYRTPAGARSSSCWPPTRRWRRRRRRGSPAARRSPRRRRRWQGRGVERTELGPLRQGDLPEELDKVAFALAEGASAAGPEPVRLARRQGHEVRPEALRPFEEVRAELEQELRRQRRGEQLPAFATRWTTRWRAAPPWRRRRSGWACRCSRPPDRPQGQNEKQEAVAADRLVPDILEAVFAGPGATPR